MATEIEPGIYRLDRGPQKGRFILCGYDARNLQYTSANHPTRGGMGNAYRYTFGATPEALAAEGIRTYKSIATARAASRRHHAPQYELPPGVAEQLDREAWEEIEATAKETTP